ncbi:MAG: N-acetyl-gamma-glutamyl-phosphate reductase [Actinomycetota bacterium]|nr:N-acetyl-gamma-glutamyl-phosphate reductase [Actinomycetota bacterium]
MKVGVIGASGYTGGELLKILGAHPKFNLSYIAAGSGAGALISDLHPHLSYFQDQRFEATEITRANTCDLIFLALPHGESAKIVNQIESSVKVVDLGADFRLSSAALWEKYYGGSHAGKWSYGLPEIKGNREIISQSSRVANPGCYATAIILSLAPFVESKVINQGDITVVAASGTTGAGRSPKVSLLASEIMNSLTSYKFGGVHQHTPEIEEQLESISKQEVKISFTPILAPIPRGILATITAVTDLKSTSDLYEIAKNYFKDEDFVEILDPKIGKLPRTSSLIGSNKMEMAVAFDSHTSRLVISSALDNLGKGAAGQAVQNANLMNGLGEDEGLVKIGIGI